MKGVTAGQVRALQLKLHEAETQYMNASCDWFDVVGPSVLDICVFLGAATGELHYGPEGDNPELYYFDLIENYGYEVEPTIRCYFSICQDDGTWTPQDRLVHSGGYLSFPLAWLEPGFDYKAAVLARVTAEQAAESKRKKNIEKERDERKRRDALRVLAEFDDKYPEGA